MGRRRAAKDGRTRARAPGIPVLGPLAPNSARRAPASLPSDSTTQPVKDHLAKGPEAAEPQAVVGSFWFDSGQGSASYTATVRFTGRRVGSRGHVSRDTFVQDETIEGVVPGTGPVSITTSVHGVPAGAWAVTGALIRPAGLRRAAHAVHPAAWSWRRWAVATGPEAPLRTRWALLAPLARQPAVIPGIYTVLGVLSIILAVAVQSAILGRGDVPVNRSLLASGLTILFGLIGAKAWYAVLHPGESIIRGGWAVDGFLIVFPIVAAVILATLDLPVGAVLDAAAPGVFFAVAIGRIGCFLTGCCAGRCTASRWSIWSSDRRVGARRIPTQLLESGAGLLLGVVTMVIVLAGSPLAPGVVFVVGYAGYTAVRQVLLPLRVERRASARTVPLTAVAAVVVAFVVATVSVVQPT
ncbi:MAG: Phosphatidylglycerol--prolipoprotein diacylglyceryl transferase [Chloroflexi bacterium]|nr:Phosphatidylglycerol--prolipoprotein diacylglyceryl transferase [Chloroflexota bacterium]